MFQTFRLSMTWLHTWFGLVLGFVLMVVFFFGSLSVFDREIDRWTVPHTRIPAQPMPSYDTMLAPIFAKLQPHPTELEDATAKKKYTGALPATFTAREFGAYTTHRDPVLAVFAEFELPGARDPDDDHVHGWATLDPRSGKVLPEDQLALGTRFFYPMHYSLHVDWLELGIWIVGLAALVMLAALVSGVVMHRKLFRELFTFRPKKQLRRSTLDLHNLTGVVALPFLFFISLSGLIIFAEIYLPLNTTLLKPLAQAEERLESTRTGLPLKAAGVAAPLASVDAMVADAKSRWAARGTPGEVGYLQVSHVGDANGYVSIYRANTDRVATSEAVHFQASTGRVIREDPPTPPVATVAGFLTGLHLQHFEHWLLRWLFFMGGLLGCVCIATGFVFFVEKRKRQHAAQGLVGSRWVDALAVTTVTGIVVATLTMLVANRLLPADLPRLGDWEKGVYWAAWALAFAHAVWRTAPVQHARMAPAWAEQCWAIAGLGLAAVLLNWATTGDHLLRTLSSRYWPVAGMDLVLIAGAALAAFAALHLRRRAAGRPAGSMADDDESTAAPGRPTPALAKARHA